MYEVMYECVKQALAMWTWKTGTTLLSTESIVE